MIALPMEFSKMTYVAIMSAVFSKGLTDEYKIFKKLTTNKIIYRTRETHYENLAHSERVCVFILM